MTVAIALCGAVGCGKGDPPPADPTHAHFERIQVLEARIDLAGAVVRTEMEAQDPDCGRACGAVARACQAARALCDLASGVEDRDAGTRCDHARAACTQLRTRAAARCPCDDGADQP
jgi:hypothetical protein